MIRNTITGSIKKSTIIEIALLAFFALVTGGTLGWALSETINIKNTEYITEFETALPTKLLDINGELITELASDEKREIISFERLPRLVVNTLLTREDRVFYKHRGYSAKAIVRAVIGQALHLGLGGGSTLTQQIAGTLYCDRSDRSIKRKIKELWWAMQMERRLSKNEILETYLNRIYFGGGTYGVNAASKYYFGHDATKITPAEAAILVIQLSNPAYYNPFDHPNRAMDRQRDVLASMVNRGYITKADADESFDEYWANFDYTRTSASAYFTRDDKAPWFSEYVRRELGNMIYGSEDIYTSGFTVNTTLDLSHQAAAQAVMDKYISQANRIWRRDQGNRGTTTFRPYVPLSELIALTFGLPGIKLSAERAQKTANDAFVDQINPVLDACSLMFGLEDLKMQVVNNATKISQAESERTTIEGTMIAIENDTGYITALVGGSQYGQGNQFIRAVQSRFQPGSTFKPLYYSAAIDSRKFTPATIISDTPTVFYKSDGTPYIPQNFKGRYRGNVQLWYALAVSLNVPAIKILDTIGFDAAIDRSAKLLGIPQSEYRERSFVPVYPFGLGVCDVRPIEMARAFAIFANGGKEVVPIAIRTVEDRNGNVIFNPERDILLAQQQKGSAAQIISPQTAYVMTQLLTNTVRSGTLAGQGAKLSYKTKSGKSYAIPLAGKTGTTQNWADAWTVAFSPYYTSAFWFGFDAKGESMGTDLNGSSLPGPAWGDFMKVANEGLPYKAFAKPSSGITEATVCSVSGGILSPACGNNRTTKYYLDGTQPTGICELHTDRERAELLGTQRLSSEYYMSGVTRPKVSDDDGLKLDLSFLNGADSEPQTDTAPNEEETLPDFNKFFE